MNRIFYMAMLLVTWLSFAPSYADDVAKIGETGYATLQDAFDAVETGQTIVLQGDLTQDDGVKFNREGVSSKLDLNSHTLTVNSGSSYNNRAVSIDAGTLEVCGGTIVAVGSGTTSTNGTGCYGAFRVEANGKLNAHDLTLTNARPWGLNVKILGGEAELTNVTINSSYGGGIEVSEADLGANSKAGKATVTNCTFTQSGYFDHCSTALSVSGGSELTVNSGTFQSENYVIYVFSSGGYVTVNGGTYTATGDKAAFKAEIDTNTYSDYTGGLKLNGGNFNGSFAITSPASTVISGGNYSVDVTQYLAPGYEVVHNGGTFTVQKAAVAQIGDTKYASLAEAIAAVPTDGTQTTITMLGDETIVGNVGVTIPKVMNVVLDLNGHTVNQIGPVAAAGYLIKNNGTLTIKDSSDTNKDGTGNGKMTTSSQDPDTGGIPSYANNLISNYGNLTIESGFYQQLTDAGYACYVVDNYSGATSNITGGKLTNVAPRTYVVRMFLNSTTATNTLNISGTAVLSGSYAVWMQYANKNANKANLNISGGRLEATDGRALYAGSAGNTARNASEIEVSITGGYIGGTGAWFGADTQFKSMTVSGGTFADFGMSVAGGNGILTGGTYESVSLFSEGRLESQCIIHENYKCIKDGNVYKIVPSTDDGEAVNIYPDRTNQVYYYWLNSNGTKGGGFYDFYAPFEGPDAVLMDQEFIELLGNVTLTKDVEYLKECSFGDPIYAGGTFNLTFGTYDINLNGFAFPLPVGVSVITDKQTNIFTPEDASLYSIRETANSDGTYTYSAVHFVAQIGSETYATLAEAIAAVPTDGTQTTITMIGDEAVEAGVTISPNQSIILELAGHKVTGNTSSNKTYALITNKGSLIIQDNTDTNLDGTGKGIITTYISDPDQGDIPGYASNTITNNGTLTVRSGKIVNNGSGYACYAIDNQTNGNLYAPVLNIEGGLMEQMNAYTYAVRMFCNSTTNINTVNVSGGVITGGYGLWLQTPNANANKGSLNIQSGTLIARDGAALYVGGTKADNSNVNIDITGGIIGGTGVIIQGPLNGTYGKVSVSGGQIQNVQCGANVEKFITGGVYVEEPNSLYLAAGYAAAKVEDENVWKVGPVTVTDLTPQEGATETAAEYKATTVVTDENNVQHEVGTNQTVSVAVVEENNVGEGVKLSDFQMNEVVTKAVVAANTEDDIDVKLIVKAAEPVVSGETVKTVTFEVHPEAIITVNGGTPTNVELTNDDLAQDATFTFVLDVTGRFNNGAAIKVVHKSEGYEDETFYSTVIDGKVTVSGITHFSDFELSEITPAAGMVAVNLTTGVQYASLADAIAAVPTDGTQTTITMIADETVAGGSTLTIADTKNIVLDLNGKTITGSSTTSSPNFYFITNKGTLEITDNSEGALGKITYGCSAATYSNEYVTICNEGGTFTLTNGTIENTSGGLSYAVNTRSVWKGEIATFNLNGGTISAPNGDAALRVYQSAGTTTTYSDIVNINGGTILDKGIFVDEYISSDLPENYDGSNVTVAININGGTVNGLIDFKMRHPFGTSLNITDGVFGNAKLWVRKYTSEYKASTEPTAPIVHISGGKFSFENNKAFGLAYDCGATSWTSYTQPYDVSGGVFNVDLNNFSGIAFPTGKTGVANTDSETSEAYPYTVGVAPVAQIGSTTYPSLAEAIAAATNDATITLLKDIVLTKDVHVTTSGENIYCVMVGGSYQYQVAAKQLSSLTIDGAGHTITMGTDAQFGDKYHLTGGCAFFFGKYGDSGELEGTYTLKNITFTGFNTEIIRSAFATVNIENCKFDGNHITVARDGTNMIYDYHGALNVDGCTFTDNMVSGTTYGLIFSNNSKTDAAITINNNLFKNNGTAQAPSGGNGIIYLSNAASSEDAITNNTFEANYVQHTSSNAAVVYLSKPVETFSGNLFKVNHVNVTSSGRKEGVIVLGSNAAGTPVIANAFVDNVLDSNVPEKRATIVVSCNSDLSNNYWGDGEAPETGSGLDIYVDGEKTITNTDFASAYVANTESQGATVTLPVYVAQIGSTTYPSLAEAFEAVADGQTITMLIDVVLPEPLNVKLAGKAVTLNLGTHTLTGRTNLKSGNLTLKNGYVAGGDKQALNVYGSSDPTEEDYSVLTIDSDVNVTADVYGVCMFGATASSNGYGAVVNINGRVVTGGDGESGAVFVSGNLGNNVSGDMHNVVNITGVVTSSTDAAVALHGNATVNVQNDAQITGNTGIAVKRGTLNVEGGTIVGNGANNPNPAANGSGTEMTGAGISMSPTYSNLGSMSVNITGGTVNSSNAKALFKQDGTYQSNATFSVSGGLFSSAVPEEFCAEGFKPKYDEATDKYTVATFEAIWADKDIVLTDGNSYEACVGEPVTQDVVVKSVKYQRYVPNANTYCAWYVPADYTLTSADLDQFNFYRINLIANAEGGNEVESTSRIWVYLFPMAANEVLTANRPYVFKTKGGTGDFTFTLEKKLHAPATDVRLNNSTTAHNYDFYGTYETTELSDNSSEHFFYVDYYGKMGYPGGSNTNVGPYRWYIKTTQKGGGAYYAPTFVFTDDSNVTGITDNLEVKTIDCYYDLKGMKIEKPGKGAYLVKFKDGTVKKVVK